MDFSGDTFTEMAMPLFVVMVLALVVPFALVPRQTRSHLTVTICIVASAILLMIAGAIITNLFDTRATEGLSSEASLYIAWLYLRESLYFGIIWAPILAFVWLNRAQRVERLRGEDMAREG